MGNSNTIGHTALLSKLSLNQKRMLQYWQSKDANDPHHSPSRAENYLGYIARQYFNASYVPRADVPPMHGRRADYIVMDDITKEPPVPAKTREFFLFNHADLLLEE